VRATYKVGQTVNVDVLVVSNHMGRFKVQVCDLNTKPGSSGRCRDLTLKEPGFNASTAGNATRSWWLPGLTQQWEGGNWGGEGPSYGGLRGEATGTGKTAVAEARHGAALRRVKSWVTG
jgi:hypothetical protein